MHVYICEIIFIVDSKGSSLQMTAVVEKALIELDENICYRVIASMLVKSIGGSEWEESSGCWKFSF